MLKLKSLNLLLTKVKCKGKSPLPLGEGLSTSLTSMGSLVCLILFVDTRIFSPLLYFL